MSLVKKNKKSNIVVRGAKEGREATHQYEKFFGVKKKTSRGADQYENFINQGLRTIGKRI